MGDANQATRRQFRLNIGSERVEELRKTARQAVPPAIDDCCTESADLVELITVDPTLKLDIRYATNDNFLGTAVYQSSRAFLRRPAAVALSKANIWLRERGFGLVVHDGYRPWYVTHIFWHATPPELRSFVGDPDKGSRHNRGAAVDLSLFDLASGENCEMPSEYDEFSPRAAAGYPGGTEAERCRRLLLHTAMEQQHFKVLDNEWWHFDFLGWESYPVENVDFEELGSESITD